tara:strand:+ start:4305 stop:5216 length:912 start_codon:yes stop_codon:yes gene_type:complete
MTTDATLTLNTPPHYRLSHTLNHVGMGARDPCLVVRGREACWGLQGPTGPIAVAAVHEGDSLNVSTFGDDSQWMQPRLADLFGLHDAPDNFHPSAAHLRTLAKKYRGMHLLKAPVLLTRLVQVVLFQLITFHDATRAWRRLVAFAGEQAPGIARLRCPPDATRLADVSIVRYKSLGISHKQAITLAEVARAAHFVESLVNVGTSELIGGLQQIPGVGPWTANYVAGTAHGAADAELLGDFHLPNTLAWMLSREQRADDARMLELLEPHRPHRFRIVRWSWAEGMHAPRRGPRASYGGRRFDRE